MNTTTSSKWAWSAPATRVAAAVMALFVLLQAALGGSFMSGSATARDLHGTLGEAVAGTLSLVVLVLAVIAWRGGYARRSTAIVALVGLAATAVQISIGIDGTVSVHVPLGVALFGLYLSMAHLTGDRRPAPVGEDAV
jgi:hypothetical protein